jgi:hypothetical protein
MTSGRAETKTLARAAIAFVKKIVLLPHLKVI